MLLKPLMKKRWLITMMMTVKSICKSPIIKWFPLMNPGTGSPSICPIEKYIKIARKMSDAMSLLRSFGVS